MRDSRLEELISAYVDGELSSDERMLVERELQQSADSRQLLEQLRQQRRLLQSLPRHSLSAKFSDEVVRRIEAAKVVQPATETREARKSGVRRQALNAMIGLAAVVAAGLLISMVMRDSKVQQNPLQPPKTDFVKQEPPLVDPEVRLVAFQQKFPLLIIYEVAITPKGRQNKVLENLLQASGIKINKTVSLAERMEKAVLESRWVAKDLVPVEGGGEKDTSAMDVEMILVRGKTKQLGDFGHQLQSIRAAAQDELHVKFDMAMSSKDLAIFLHLNDAVDGEQVLREVSSDTWSTPGAFSVKFRYAFNTKAAPKLSTTAAPSAKVEIPATLPGTTSGATAKLAVNKEDKQAAPAPGSAGMSLLQRDENEPTQVLLIVRHLTENVTFPAVKAAN